MKNDLISQKIEELIEIAKKEGDKSTELILLTLEGAKLYNCDKLLAKKVQEHLKEILTTVQRDKFLNAVDEIKIKKGKLE